MSQSQRKQNKFLLFCSGASKEILQKCPESEYNKYIGIGISVLLTGILAAVAGGYAIHYVFDSLIYSFPFGVVWGFMILNLDRVIISSMRKRNNFGGEFLHALPRIILALVIAVVISRPFELRLFKDEIDQYLVGKLESEKLSIDNIYEEKINNVEKDLQEKEKSANDKNDGKKSKDRDEIRKLEIQLTKYQGLRDVAYNSYKCECDGTCGTNSPGDGPECKRKRKHYETTQKEFETQTKLTNSAIKKIQDQILEKDSVNESILHKYQIERDTIISDIRVKRENHKIKLQEQFSESFLARSNALWELSKSELSILVASLFITFLFIIIEITPVFVKLISPKGAYDYLLIDEIEKTKHKISKTRIDEKIDLYDKKIKEYDAQIMEYEQKEKIEVSKAFIKEKTPLEIDKVKELLNTWKNNKFDSSKYLNNLNEKFENTLMSIISSKLEEFNKINDGEEEVIIYRNSQASPISENKTNQNKKSLRNTIKKTLDNKFTRAIFVFIIICAIYKYADERYKEDFERWRVLLPLYLTITSGFLIELVKASNIKEKN
ncbi:hypothetical protein IMCC3317_32320 [Kordia antarctica]|uniref:DUF4407 domain-containing protein n=1 Tax=Kordia antarctica TaxID=1218801 RepID=A0A7L4ZN36_9FLAO|nr:DUF4407 domain-containing protein [Kordia antarctica]QHI37849.1 hypothetical protein IMCC3317_32320 [Kordia antarctica]